MECEKRSKPRYYVGDQGDWKFKTTYGSHLTIMGGVISRVIPGRPFKYNLSDKDGKSIAEGIHEDHLELQKDESRSLWFNRTSKDEEKSATYYRRGGQRQMWISRLFSPRGLGLFWSRHRDMLSLLGVIIYFLVRHKTSWRKINHLFSKYPIVSFTT